jgi:hypothetical protein
MSIEAMLYQRAVHERATRSVDATGDVILEWEQVDASLPCRIELRRINENLRPVGEIVRTEARGFFPVGTDLRPSPDYPEADRVTVESRVYRVRSLLPSDSRQQLFVIAELEVV